MVGELMSPDGPEPAMTEAEAIAFWQRVPCPACHAHEGKPCTLLNTSLKGRPMHLPHLARRDAAEAK